MKQRVHELYRWEFNGVMIEGIVEYVGAYGVIASRYPHVRCQEPRPGDWIDQREWKAASDSQYIKGHEDFGRIGKLNYLDDGDFHFCTHEGSCYLGPNAAMDGAYASISGGPWYNFYQDDLVPTMELRTGRYWNFRGDSSQADNDQNYRIARPVFKLVANPRKVKAKEIQYDDNA